MGCWFLPKHRTQPTHGCEVSSSSTCAQPYHAQFRLLERLRLGGGACTQACAQGGQGGQAREEGGAPRASRFFALWPSCLSRNPPHGPQKRHKDKKQKKEKKEKKDKKHKRSHGGDSGGTSAALSEVQAAMNPISEDDYFLKTKEFQLWLQETERKYLDEMPAKEARESFTRFVAAWNRKTLPAKFYVGLPGDAGATRASRHQWSFASKITEQEQFQLDRAQEKVAPSREQERLGRKQWLAHDKQVMEEMLPRPDPGSRAAQLEKRQREAAYHRTERADGLEMPDAALMGGGAPGGRDSWAGAMAARQQATARRNDDKSARLAELQAKEQARMDAFKASMAGLL